jgi:NADH dehydrogenase
MSVATRLERRLRRDEAEIVLIARENFSLFTPMLPEVCSGALDVRHIVTPIRPQLRRTNFVLADVDSIDVAESRVTFTHMLTSLTQTLDYDHLVLALGSSTSTFGIPGVAERAFALKTLEDAATLRNRLIWLLELADSTTDAELRRRLLTIVVVGGGFTGVETAGELVELFRSVVRFYRNVAPREIQIVLLEAGSVLLPGLPARMGSYAARDLVARGVRVVTGDGVAAVDDTSIVMESGNRIDAATAIWSAGVKPAPLLAAASLPKSKHGAVIVGPDFRAADAPKVWAAGDCAAIPNGTGGYYPATAQHAVREGPLLADNIVATLRRRPLRAFRFSALGMMASLGARKAVAQLPGDRVLTGFFAWFLWRTYYLFRLPGFDRKLRVAFDWTLDLLFPRDLAELRVHTRQAQSSAAADAGLLPKDEPVVRL